MPLRTGTCTSGVGRGEDRGTGRRIPASSRSMDSRPLALPASCRMPGLKGSANRGEMPSSVDGLAEDARIQHGFDRNSFQVNPVDQWENKRCSAIGQQPLPSFLRSALTEN